MLVKAIFNNPNKFKLSNDFIENWSKGLLFTYKLVSLATSWAVWAKLSTEKSEENEKIMYFKFLYKSS